MKIIIDKYTKEYIAKADDFVIKNGNIVSEKNKATFIGDTFIIIEDIAEVPPEVEPHLYKYENGEFSIYKSIADKMIEEAIDQYTLFLLESGVII